MEATEGWKLPSSDSREENVAALSDAVRRVHMDQSGRKRLRATTAP